MPDRTRGLSNAAGHARRFLEQLEERTVAAAADASRVRELLGDSLSDRGEDPETVIESLATGADAGIVASAGPRHFGFVIGGSLPAALAADWLVSAWDQVPGFHVLSPAVAAIEDITAGWILELLRLPPAASVGFVTGGQAANTTCLAAARHRVLQRAGWDVERDGLVGAPRVHVVTGSQAHVTVDRSLRLLGLGAESAVRVPADDQGRMRPDALRAALAGAEGPRHRLRAGRKRRDGRVRPVRRHRRGLRRPRRLAARRRGLRAVGRRRAVATGAHPRRGAGGLLGSRRPQVAQRPLRRRDGDRPRRGGAPRGDVAGGTVPGGQPGSARFVELCPGVVAPGPRRAGVRRPSLARARRRRRARGAQLRAGSPDGRAARARRPGRRDPQRRGTQPGARALPGRGRREPRDRRRGAARGDCWLGGTDHGGEHVVRISFSNWSTTDEDVDRSAAVIAAAAGARGGA